MKPWLQQSGEGFQSLLALRPELQKKYQEFLSVVENNESVPEQVYDLCRARIQHIHGLRAEDVVPGNDGETVALVAADRIPYQHHQLSDGEVDALKTAFGDQGCVALLTALAFFDVTCRLEATFNSAQMSEQ
ncbi:MAG: hypothetical protein ISP91_14105 [Pseudomonadales bacterium]|nr:hypothetical protein [Pseudomonadales bacterium]